MFTIYLTKYQKSISSGSYTVIENQFVINTQLKTFAASYFSYAYIASFIDFQNYVLQLDTTQDK